MYGVVVMASTLVLYLSVVLPFPLDIKPSDIGMTDNRNVRWNVMGTIANNSTQLRYELLL